MGGLIFGEAEESTGGNFPRWGVGGSKFSNGGKKTFAWEVKLFLFSHIPNIFAGNILLKTGKILSNIAFSKLFLNHVKVPV